MSVLLFYDVRGVRRGLRRRLTPVVAPPAFPSERVAFRSV